MKTTITLGELISEEQLTRLVAYLRSDKAATPHAKIMEWLNETNDGKAVAKKMEGEGILLDYGAYLLEFAIMKLK